MDGPNPLQPLITNPSLYNSPGSINVKLPYHEAQLICTEDNNILSGKDDTGIVAHVDDSGAETTLFMDRQPQSLSSRNYPPGASSFVVHQRQVIPAQMEQFVADPDSNLFIRSKLASSIQPVSSSLTEENVTNNIEMSHNVSNPFLVDVQNASDITKRISVPSNLDPFPFSLAVETTTDD